MSSSLNPQQSVSHFANQLDIWTVLVYVLLGVVIVLNLPLFLAMPLTADTALYDLQANVVAEGGTLYRDIFEPNLPGVVWVHYAVRHLAGQSSEALRAADLLCFTMIAVALCIIVRRAGRTPRIAVLCMALMCLFYSSMSEWCHCQRDTWMLLPALVAIYLRANQIRRLSDDSARSTTIVAWSILEGLVWGIGFWIKPFIAIPALGCCLVSVFQVRRLNANFVDVASVVVGGIIAGSVGIAWMHASGAWTYFVEILFDWNPSYFLEGRDRWTISRLQMMAGRFSPWLLIHLIAVPIAIYRLKTFVQESRQATTGTLPQRDEVCQILLSALYLGWLVQSFLLQHLLDYIHVPAVLLGITVVACWRPKRELESIARVLTVAFVCLAITHSPMIRPNRLACWTECVQNGSTSAVRDALSDSPFVSWTELDAVADFLRGEGIGQGELTCFHGHLVHLYHKLQLQPSTRYVYLETLAGLFPDRQSEIVEALQGSKQRFVVTELVEGGLPLDQALAIGPHGQDQPPPGYNELPTSAFPWCYPVVFRSGRYLVHRVDGPVDQFPGSMNPPKQVRNAEPGKKSTSLAHSGPRAH